MPGRSDIDVLAVARSRLDRETKTRIVDALREEALPGPARGLEFVLYPEDVVRTSTVEPGFDLELNSGPRMPFHAALHVRERPPQLGTFWYAVDRAIAREHGRTLFGPPAADLFAPIPHEALVPLLVEGLRWHVSRGLSRDDDAVLNACRALRYGVERVWSSKAEAGEWALASAHPVDRTLVAGALASRSSGEHLPRADVEAFVRQIARLLELQPSANPQGGLTPD